MRWKFILYCMHAARVYSALATPIYMPHPLGEMVNNTTVLVGGYGCDLTGWPSFLLQLALGVIAFSTLLLKRLKEPAIVRRPLLIWMADTTKQAVGMLGVHGMNLLLSELLPVKNPDPCIIYLVSFLLDSTLGLLIIYLLLRIVAIIVNRCSITALKSGQYGEPFSVMYWAYQCGIVLVIMLLMKLVTGPLVIFQFWTTVGRVLLPSSRELRTAIVIFIVPFIVNVLMFWIVDSFLMRKTLNVMPALPSVSYQRQPEAIKTRYHRVHDNSDDDGTDSDHL